MITRLIYIVLGALVSNYLSGFYAGMNSATTVKKILPTTEEEDNDYAV